MSHREPGPREGWPAVVWAGLVLMLAVAIAALAVVHRGP